MTISVNGTERKIFVYPLIFTMDLIAKAQFLNMVQHNGYFGCSKCNIRGDHVQQKKGYCHIYPFEDSLTTLPRSDEQMQNDALNAVQSKKSVCIMFCLTCYLYSF